MATSSGRFTSRFPLKIGNLHGAHCRFLASTLSNTGVLKEHVLTGVTSAPAKTPTEVIHKLQLGNQRFMEGRGTLTGVQKESLIPDPLSPTTSECTIIVDAACGYGTYTMFDAPSGTLRPVRVCGVTLEPNDSIVGSLEFLVDYFKTPVLLVLGNYNNDPIKIAVQKAMKQAGRDDVPNRNELALLEDLPLVDKAMPAAQDALAEAPRNSFMELVYQAAVMNIWRNIETILSSSVTISKAVACGELQVHGAFLEVDTKRVKFLGQHPLQEQILSTPPKSEVIRTAKDPPVPSIEALASLIAGNKRYTTGHGGTMQVNDTEVKQALSSSGQNPIAVVVGCADSRAPIEIIFDMKPGDLFVLRNAGNSCNETATCNMKGSMDYAIQVLRCKLVVVMGHTQCGAVTAAVSAVRSGTMDQGLTGIGTVLSYIEGSAERAVKELPNATLEEQVVLATEYNIQDTMRKIMEHSLTANDAVTRLDLQVHGAIYDLFSGEVKWLGQHPEVERFVPKMPVELHRWQTQEYNPAPAQLSPGRSVGARATLKRLIEGNRRFVEDSASQYASAMVEGNEAPCAVILASSEIRAPAEAIFDQTPNSLIVQLTMGGIEKSGAELFTASLEFAFLKYRPHVFVVLAMAGQLPEVALEQLTGCKAPSEPMRRVLTDVMKSTLQSLWQVDKMGSCTQAGRLSLIKAITVELNAWYIIEELLSYSSILRNAVKNGDLEIHAAAVAPSTGRAEFLGEHPMMSHLISLNPANP